MDWLNLILGGSMIVTALVAGYIATKVLFFLEDLETVSEKFPGWDF